MSLACSAALRNLTSSVTILTYTNDTDNALIAQALAKFGDGTNNLCGTGGDYEFKILYGSNIFQPNPQKITFDTSTRAAVSTEQIVIPRGQTITLQVKSPNVADTSVWVSCCLYDAGDSSLGDELESLEILYTTMRAQLNVYDARTYPGGGLYPYRL